VWFVGLLIFLFPSISRGQQPTAPKQILVLYWYNRDWPGNVIFDKNFQQVLDSEPAGSVEYFSEYLESNRFPGESQSLALRDFLRQKYADHRIDVAVAVTEEPLDFLLRYREDLFPNTPIVFITSRRPTPEQLNAGPGLTGILQGGQFKSTLDLALRLHPESREVFIVSGTLNHDKRFELMCREDLPDYGTRVSITYLTDLAPDELILKTQQLPERSIILYMFQQSQNEQGKIVESQENLESIARVARVPIYGLSNRQVGQGIVGGIVRIVDANGTRAAEIALRIVHGQSAKDIPLETTPVVPMFDWRQLERWGISESSLPSGNIVRFRVPSFWDEYKWQFIGFVSLLILQSALISGMLITRSRRRRAEVERERFASLAEAERRHLDEFISNVPGIAWESRVQPDTSDRKVDFVNQYVEKLLGYTVEEWLSKPNFPQSVIHEEDRERVARETQTILETGKGCVLQFRFVAKDGRELWVESHRAPMRDDTGKIIGLRGVTIDITDRKLSDESYHRSEERNRAILRAIPDLMFVQTTDGIYLDYHAKSPDDLLVSPADFLGKNMRDVLPVELAEKVSRCFRRAHETSEPQTLEYSLQLNGEEQWFEARMVSTQGDKILSIVRDITDRKLAELALVDNDAMMAGIVGSAMDAIIFVNDSRRIVLVNPAAEKMFGCAESEVIGERVDLFIPERYQQSLQQEIFGFNVTTGTARSIGLRGERHWRRAGGEEFPIEGSVSQVELQGQKFYTVMLRDVTARRQALHALRQSEEVYRQLFEQNIDGIFIAAPDGHYLDVSPVGCQMLGMTREEVLSRTWFDIIAPGEEHRIPDAVALLADGKVHYSEWRFRRKDGSEFIGELTARQLADGRFQGIVRDITERYQAREAVRESEERFRNMADTAPVMIWLSGTDGLCTYFNQQWINFAGRTVEEELGTGWTDGVHPEDVQRCLAIYTFANDMREAFTMEFRLRRADGNFRWFLNSGTPRWSPSGSFLGYIGSCIDITERKEAEQALANLSGQLIQAREDECARIARELHDDLNQRMALVSVEIEQIIQSFPVTPETLGRTLLSVLRQIKETSKEIHRMSYDLHPAKLTHLGLVSALEGLCEELRQHHQVKIDFTHYQVPNDLARDISLCIYRTVQECLNNVVKHSDAQSARIQLIGTDGELTLSVSDSGVGFDIESPRFKNGLGLMSMRERLRLVGGRISIVSRPSRGTQIVARVPLAQRRVKNEDYVSIDRSKALGD